MSGSYTPIIAIAAGCVIGITVVYPLTKNLVTDLAAAEERFDELQTPTEPSVIRLYGTVRAADRAKKLVLFEADLPYPGTERRFFQLSVTDNDINKIERGQSAKFLFLVSRESGVLRAAANGEDTL